VAPPCGSDYLSRLGMAPPQTYIAYCIVYPPWMLIAGIQHPTTVRAADWGESHNRGPRGLYSCAPTPCAVGTDQRRVTGCRAAFHNPSHVKALRLCAFAPCVGDATADGCA